MVCSVWPPHLFSFAFVSSGFIKAASSTANMVTNLRQDAHQKGASLCRMRGLRISRRVVSLSLFIFHPSLTIFAMSTKNYQFKKWAAPISAHFFRLKQSIPLACLLNAVGEEIGFRYCAVGVLHLHQESCPGRYLFSGFRRIQSCRRSPFVVEDFLLFLPVQV
jgi:hypothetical protein